MKFRIFKHSLAVFTLFAAVLAPLIASAVVPIGISNIDIQVTDDSATITWTTNVPTRARIEFGESTEYDLFIEAGYQPRTDHEIRLVNLHEDTTYHYRIIARNSETQAVTFDRSFDTLEGGDGETPEIVSYSVVYQTATTATFQWQTSEPTYGTVFFGTSSDNLSRSVGSRHKNYFHDVTLNGLNVATPYFARLHSRDEDGNLIVSNIIEFRTAPVSDGEREILRISKIQPTTSSDATIFSNGAVITWETNKLSNGYVTIGTKQDGRGRQIPEQAFRNFNHRVVVDGLQPDTQYYFRVASRDIFNKFIESSPIAIQTKSAFTPGINPNTGETTGQVAVLPASESAIFYANFDQSINATVAAGNPLPISTDDSPQISPNEGRFGGAVYISPQGGVSYSGAGNFNIQAGTVMFWVRPNWGSNDTKDRLLFSVNTVAVDAGGKYFYINKPVNILNQMNALHAGLEDASDDDVHHITTDHGFTNGKWTHIAFSWSYPGETRLYVDGVLKVRQGISSRVPDLGEKFNLGELGNQTDAYYDEFMIFNRVLTPAEIQSQMQSPDISGERIQSENVQVLGVSVDSSFTPATALYRAPNRPEVYAILNGQKYHIPSAEAFERYGYRYGDIETISAERLAAIPDVRLVKTPTDDRIYWLYQRNPNRRLKWYLPTPQIFESYPVNRYENVVTIAPEDMDTFSQARLIKKKSSPAVYLVEGTKRPIQSAEVFERHGFDYDDVVEVSDANLEYIPTGAPLR